MKLRIDKVNKENSTQMESLIKWDCDRELCHLVNPLPQDFHYPEYADVLKKYQDDDFIQSLFMIFDSQKPIGYVTLDIDPPQLIKREKRTSWLALVIGERDYWGSEAGAFAMSFLEEESKRRKVSRIEVGVFEFNMRAYKFFQKFGYQDLGRKKNLTFYENRFWDGIHMEKLI